jgi:hypothetical protein
MVHPTWPNTMTAIYMQPILNSLFQCKMSLKGGVISNTR